MDKIEKAYKDGWEDGFVARCEEAYTEHTINEDWDGYKTKHETEFQSASLPGSTGDEVDAGKGLASFGAAVLEYMKPLIADGMMDETLEDIAQIAVGQSVLKEVTYDPKIHVDVNEEWCDFEPGDKIYYWGKEASA